MPALAHSSRRSYRTHPSEHGDHRDARKQAESQRGFMSRDYRRVRACQHAIAEAPLNPHEQDALTSRLQEARDVRVGDLDLIAQLARQARQSRSTERGAMRSAPVLTYDRSTCTRSEPDDADLRAGEVRGETGSLDVARGGLVRVRHGVGSEVARSRAHERVSAIPSPPSDLSGQPLCSILKSDL